MPEAEVAEPVDELLGIASVSSVWCAGRGRAKKAGSRDQEARRLVVEEYIGIIKLFAGGFAPTGWAGCEGQLLPINNNEALFSILGTTYGGDGRTNFALPNL